MKTILTLVVAVLLCTHAHAQFQIRYSTQNYDWPRALDRDNKDGYIVAGSTLNGSWSPFLLRLDNNGSWLWSYTYNLPGIDEHFLDVTYVDWSSQTQYAAVGQADGVAGMFGVDEYFIMTNGSGVPIALKRFLTTETDIARHIEPIKHPQYGYGFIITGYTYHNLTTQEKDINVLITDKSGNLVKSVVLLAPLNQEAHAIEPTKDGGFIITAETELAQTCDKKEVNVLIIKLNSDLKVLWSYTFDFVPSNGTTDDRAYIAKEDSNGEIQVAGTSRIYINNVYDHDEPFQLHLKSDGNPVWLRTYNVDTYPSAEAVSLVTKTADDGSIIYTLSGRTYQNFEALLFQTDYNGDPLWGRTYPPNYSLSATNAEDLVENEIKGYSFTGRMLNAVSPSTSYDIHVVKTDENGKSGEPCEKEVKVLSYREKLCQEKFEYRIATMRQVTISTDNIKLDLKPNKCQDGASSLLEQPMLTPNPGEGIIRITGISAGSSVSFYDQQGMLKKKANFAADEKVDVSDLAAGIYIVEVIQADGTVNRYRFIKE